MAKEKHATVFPFTYAKARIAIIVRRAFRNVVLAGAFAVEPLGDLARAHDTIAIQRTFSLVPPGGVPTVAHE